MTLRWNNAKNMEAGILIFFLVVLVGSLKLFAKAQEEKRWQKVTCPSCGLQADAVFTLTFRKYFVHQSNGYDYVCGIEIPANI